MSRKDGERDFRLRPERPIRVRDDIRAWSAAFKRIIHFARTTSRRAETRPTQRTTKAYNQRCAIRVTYVGNKVTGQWAAHGRYISRESAAGQESTQRGFGSSGPDVDIPSMLGDWQRARDPRIFKLINSPEFGDRLELEAHTRGLMERMEQDLGTKLEWVAIIHRNTEHPHVHVALRGVDGKGAALRLPREFIKSGIRQHAEEIATQQLGYRTQMDAEEAERREVHQARFTSLDRSIRKAGQLTHDGVSITVPDDLRSGYARKRLLALQEMGIRRTHRGKKLADPGQFRAHTARDAEDR